MTNQKSKDNVNNKRSSAQLVILVVMSSVLTHALGSQIKPISAASTTSTEPQQSSSQPLWSYQVKPNNYVNAPQTQAGPYGVPGGASGIPSLFDTFQGLSQRQGALSGSPFLSILPIILIAAGGMLLLLPILTMMMASPFSGGFGAGGYNGGFGYPQVGALNKKRSLGDQFAGQRSLVDLIEHVSSSIEEMTKKYSNPSQAAASSAAPSNKRAKSLNSQAQTAAGEPVNHRPAATSGNNNEEHPSGSGALSANNI